MKASQNKLHLAVLICALFPMAGCLLHAQEIRFAASDLLADFIQPELERSAKESGIDFSFESMGSLPAMQRLRSGELDLAILAFPEGASVPRQEFNAYSFAYDAAIIAVNRNNPLDEISLARLAGIYGSSESFNFNTWGDVGLSGWGSRKIKPLSGHAEGSIVLELFKNTVLLGNQLKTSVDVVREDEVFDLLKADPAAVAILSRVPGENTGSKVLLLSTDDNAPAYGPTVDNIHFGDYPVRISFLVVGPDLEDDRKREILRILWNDELAASLSENGIFPLPETVRRKLLIDLDLYDPVQASPVTTASP